MHKHNAAAGLEKQKHKYNVIMDMFMTPKTHSKCNWLTLGIRALEGLTVPKAGKAVCGPLSQTIRTDRFTPSNRPEYN